MENSEKTQQTDLKGRLFDFTHEQARDSVTIQYLTGKEIANAYVSKYGKEDLKRSMKSISQLLEVKPPEEIERLYRSIDQHELGDALKGFYDALREKGALDNNSSQNGVFMKFQADWMKFNPRIGKAHG